MTALLPPVATQPGTQLDDFDLDVQFAESGQALDVLVQLTGDNCGSTCESACVSCP
jgi:FxLD family lantipeptide